MGRVLTIEQTIKIAKKLKHQGETIILVGGCFDILHVGHIEFLSRSKQLGETLFVLLESDASIRRSKGERRPIQNQKDRAKILSKIEDVDYIVMLPLFSSDKEYYSLVKKIKPDIIAVTEGDPLADTKENQARSVGGKVVAVIRKMKQYSSSKLERYL